MDREEIANLVQDALDKKLSGILGAFTKLAERVDKYVEKNTEPETETERLTKPRKLSVISVQRISVELKQRSLLKMKH